MDNGLVLTEEATEAQPNEREVSQSVEDDRVHVTLLLSGINTFNKIIHSSIPVTRTVPLSWKTSEGTSYTRSSN